VIRCPSCSNEVPQGSRLCPSCRCVIETLEAASESTEDPDSTRTEPASSGEDSRSIGPYRILQKLGEGGMGEVYEAEQEQPVRRRVALKVIKPGMDSKQVIARFESERQALALMSHPSIAQVYDAGTTKEGRPYFAMEHVKGEPITDYCDKHRLTTPQRLELFIQICDGVQHAHQKGIIHRDLKPSNVLVTIHGEKPSSKIIDFGVAKATGQRLTEKTMYTAMGMLVGTPEYMSPEQAEMTALDIDTRTDIYSLGVLLYELLVGALPFERRRLREAGYSEMQRIIREEEPSRPSTRVRTLETAGEVAQQRHTDLRSLQKQLRGDLDWIVMKALEKDRTRRYASASEFAADVGRYLGNEPVAARPPSTAYLVRKFVTKHRGPVVAVTTVVVSIVLLGSAAFWQGRIAQKRAMQVRAHSILAAAAAVEDPLLKAQLVLEVADVPELPGRLNVAREAANAPLPVAVLRGHEGMLRSVVFSPDGSRVLTASEDGTARIWRADGTGEPVVLLGHDYWVTRAVFSPDGTSVLTISSSGARVWRADGTGAPILLHEGAASAVFSPDGTRVLMTSWDGTVRVMRPDGEGQPVVFEIQSGEDMWRMAQRGYGSGAVFSPDGTRVLTTAPAAGTARIWRADGTGQPVVFRGHEDWVARATFSPDGSKIVTASRDRTARVWRADGTGEPIILRHPRAVTASSFSPDGSLVVTASLDGMARVWRADGTGEAIAFPWATTPREWGSPWPGGHVAVFSPDGNLVATNGRVWRADGSGPLVLHHQAWAGGFPFSRDGTRLVTACGFGTACVWRTDTRGEAAVLGIHGDGVNSARFSPDGSRVVTASSDGTARIWPNDGKGAPIVLRGHEGKVRTAAFSPDGERVVTGSDDGTARVRRADGTGQPIVLRGHGGFVDSVVFSPDGTQVATTSRDGTVRVWRADGSGESVVQGHPTEAAASPSSLWWWGYDLTMSRVAFSPDGTRVVTGSEDGGVRVWPANGIGEPVLLHQQKDAVRVIAFSPDGTRVVSAGGWDWAYISRADGTGESIVLRGHLDTVNDVAFSPDGNRVATASDDLTVRVWRADGTGQPIVLRGHRQDAQAVAFSPDGQWIVSADLDGIVHVWKADGTEEPMVLRGHEDMVNTAAFSPDGTSVLTASDDGTARIWRVTWQGLVEYLRQNTKTCLTAVQRVQFLAESPSDARVAHAACEARHGRKAEAGVQD
jgi:WD40 repeat protein/serine/threonine protein kinase